MTLCNPDCPYPTFDCNQDWVHTPAGGYVLSAALQQLIETGNFDKAVDFMNQILECPETGCPDLARAIAFLFPYVDFGVNPVNTLTIALDLVRQNFAAVLDCVVCNVFAFLRCIPSVGENGSVSFLGCFLAQVCTATNYAQTVSVSQYPSVVIDLVALARGIVQALCSCEPDQTALLLSALEAAVATAQAAGSDLDVVACFEQLTV